MDVAEPPGLATSEDVAAAVVLAREKGRLGIDTEFMSEGRYRALLCLVQVVVDDPDGPGGTRIHLIDPLRGGVEVTPLAQALADPAIEVVLHAARQDVALLRRVWSTQVTRLFDTQIAAGFAGGGAQTGYGNLLQSMLGRHVGKTASYTRWDARPLTAEQMSYAAEDVEHLLELADVIQERLRGTGRLDWAREECARLESVSDERDPDTAWERLPRVSQLDPRARAVARELAAWRERTASTEDRPVSSVFADQALVEIAKRQPTSAKALETIRGLHPSGIRRRGPDILAAVQRGIEAPPVPRETRRGIGESGDAPLTAAAEALLRARAIEAGLAYELIASRAELDLIIATARRGDPEPEVRTLSGWRRELVGRDLSDLLSGRLAIAIERGRRLRLVPTDVAGSAADAPDSALVPPSTGAVLQQDGDRTAVRDERVVEGELHGLWPVNPSQ